MKKLTFITKVLAAAMVAVLVLGTGAWTGSDMALAHGKKGNDGNTVVQQVAATVTVAGVPVVDGAVVNGKVTITVTKGSGTVRLNNRKLVGTKTIKVDGKYKVTVKDSKGQPVSTLNFTIDSKKPMINVKAGKRCYQLLRNGGFAIADVKVTVKDKIAVTTTVTKDDVEIPFGTGVFTAEGKYIVTSVDKAGNTATATFTIDLTNPVITVTDSNGAAVANKATVVGPVKVVATDTNLKKVQVQKLHSKWRQEKSTFATEGTLSDPGTYRITAIDKACRTTTFQVTIQAAAPVTTPAQ